ncbi:MAG TPA: hypothetical protein VFW52_03480 [Candidatus Saccharimonadales bacterium]|nr:hypothetical protein [Candidatus Saccharimonadales bacterium]
MTVKPKYDLIEAAAKAAHGVYERLDGRFNADVVLWEVLEINRVSNVGGYIIDLIDDLGLEHYKKIREEIESGVDPKR